MSRSKKSKLERNAQKITLIKMSRDKQGRYISYCDYGNHLGVIGEKKALGCRQRQCNYYMRLREKTYS